MKCRPIIFSAPMVRAILDGRKTQTRRVARPVRHPDLGNIYTPGALVLEHEPRHVIERACPYGKPGDRLWVRETWQYYDWNEEGEPCIRFSADNSTTWPEPGLDAWEDKLVDVWADLSRTENYSIDNRASDRRWRPSIHMPRWASRITLEVTGVRVERLQDISDHDALAEGADQIGDCDGACVAGFRRRLEYIHGPESWDANPWVWVIEFKRVEGGTV
jgi:hypothetical protein